MVVVKKANFIYRLYCCAASQPSWPKACMFQNSSLTLHLLAPCAIGLGVSVSCLGSQSRVTKALYPPWPGLCWAHSPHLFSPGLSPYAVAVQTMSMPLHIALLEFPHFSFLELPLLPPSLLPSSLISLLLRFNPGTTTSQKPSLLPQLDWGPSSQALILSHTNLYHSTHHHVCKLPTMISFVFKFTVYSLTGLVQAWVYVTLEPQQQITVSVTY